MTADTRRVESLAVYNDGLQAIEQFSSAITDWSAATPCRSWRAVDLAGHLLAIAQYYHRLLDASAAGHVETGLPRGAALAEMNARDLAGLPESSGPARIASFLTLAHDYGRRLGATDWRQPLGEWQGLGPLTIEQHSGLAIVEWHVHAWDLAQSSGHDYSPAHVAVIAAGCGALPGPPPAPNGWQGVLAWSGRT